jgi:acyl dehydratase
MSCISASTREFHMSARLHFEDFRIGQMVSFGTHRISADEIIEFAAEFDPQPQHLDPVAAKSSMLGGLAASGWHLCALAMRMMVDGLFQHAASMGSPGVEEVQWRKPVYAGDLLQLSAEVLETRASSRPDRGYVRFRFTMSRQAKSGEPERVMIFVSPVILGRKPEAA